MRRYSALFDKGQRRWSVIARDDYDGYWFMWTPDAGDKGTAQQIADALNHAQDRY